MYFPVDQGTAECPDVHMDQIYICAELSQNTINGMVIQFDVENDTEKGDGT